MERKSGRWEVERDELFWYLIDVSELKASVSFLSEYEIHGDLSRADGAAFLCLECSR